MLYTRARDFGRALKMITGEIDLLKVAGVAGGIIVGAGILDVIQHRTRDRHVKNDLTFDYARAGYAATTLAFATAALFPQFRFGVSNASKRVFWGTLAGVTLLENLNSRRKEMNFGTYSAAIAAGVAAYAVTKAHGDLWYGSLKEFLNRNQGLGLSNLVESIERSVSSNLVLKEFFSKQGASFIAAAASIPIAHNVLMRIFKSHRSKLTDHREAAHTSTATAENQAGYTGNTVYSGPLAGLPEKMNAILNFKGRIGTYYKRPSIDPDRGY